MTTEDLRATAVDIVRPRVAPDPLPTTLPARGRGTGPLSDRVRADGKHLSCAGLPFRVKGATYGSFRARRDGQLFPEAEQIRADLTAMAQTGLNTLRTYTTPPVELLETASELGLRVMAGVHYDDWRQVGTGRAAHRSVLDAGRRALDEAMERLDGEPAVLAVSIGNEVPCDLVRLHGIRPVECVLSQLAAHVHAADPAMLVTYSNFPTTEFLHVDGLDLTCFNVFLEDPAKLTAYLRHLQVVAGQTPLLVTELGLAGDLHGDLAQAVSVEQQLRAVDEAGCAGATLFSWTDEWAVAGEAVEGWGFGLTGTDRAPKPALDVVRRWANRDIRDLRESWPTVSVVVCAYNEERLLDECLTALDLLDYPALEVIVCDDGSTDRTLEIARRYPFRTLALPHGGLSATRNAGARAARGTYVAYLDADAHCHPEWPYHLVLSMEDPGVVATGGPNLPVPGSPFVERAVSLSPGGPTEVLVADDRAEHVPGCNMTLRRDALLAVGGFDEVFTSAGDDVDLCWKLLDAGGQIAFAPAAQVRHHRRSTVRDYLRQQRNYGRSERMVAARHPHRFNRLGQARWAGSIYGGLRMLPAVLRPVVYHGSIGSAPYQTVLRQRGAALLAWWGALLPLTAPVALLALALVAWAWAPLGLVLLAGNLTFLAGYAGVVLWAARPERGERAPWRWRALLTFLHVAQPYVRTWGRLAAGRIPVRRPQRPAEWTGDRERWVVALHDELAARSARVRFSTCFSPWDLMVSVGPLVKAQVTTAVAWGWIPSAAVRLRPRRLPVIATAATAGFLLAAGAEPPDGTVLLIVLLALVTGAALEALALRRFTLAAIARTAVVVLDPPTVPAREATP